MCLLNFGKRPQMDLSILGTRAFHPAVQIRCVSVNHHYFGNTRRWHTSITAHGHYHWPNTQLHAHSDNMRQIVYVRLEGCPCVLTQNQHYIPHSDAMCVLSPPLGLSVLSRLACFRRPHVENTFVLWIMIDELRLFCTSWTYFCQSVADQKFRT